MSFAVVDRDQRSNEKSIDDVLSSVWVVLKPVEKHKGISESKTKESIDLDSDRY